MTNSFQFYKLHMYTRMNITAFSPVAYVPLSTESGENSSVMQVIVL